MGQRAVSEPDTGDSAGEPPAPELVDDVVAAAALDAVQAQVAAFQLRNRDRLRGLVGVEHDGDVLVLRARIAVRLRAIDAEPTPSSPDEFARFIAAEVAKWQKVVTTANIKIN